MEQRVQTLEREVGDLRVTVAEQSVQINHLITALRDSRDEMKAMRDTLQPLSDAVQKGRGGLAVMNLLAVIAGGAVVAATSRLLNWGS